MAASNVMVSWVRPMPPRLLKQEEDVPKTRPSKITLSN
jgi:hypothetical protein